MLNVVWHNGTEWGGIGLEVGDSGRKGELISIF